MAGSTDWTRREFLAGSVGVLLSAHPSIRPSAQDTLPEAGPSGKLWDPGRAGRPAEPTTAADNDAAIQAIEKRLKCTCGCGLDIYTCRTTDFSCPVSPGLHRKVVALAQAGMTGEQIIADFVRENGIQMLMAPPARGFNLTAYFLPGSAILGVGVALLFVIRRWARRVRPATGTVVAGPPTATASELEQLRRELEHFQA